MKLNITKRCWLSNRTDIMEIRSYWAISSFQISKISFSMSKRKNRFKKEFWIRS